MCKTPSALLALCSVAVAVTQAQRPTRPPASKPTDAWEVDTTRSEMTDEPSVTLSLKAISPEPESLLEIRPRLIVRCKEKELELYVSTGSVLDADNDMTPVRVRWGTAEPQEAFWGRSTNYTAAFAPEPRTFLKQLLTNPDLRFEVHPYDAAPKVIRFDARGLDRHITQLDAACPVEKKEIAGLSDTVFINLDPGSGVVPSRDQVFVESVVDERPEILSGPSLVYPDLLRQAGIQGRVLVQAIIDTMGRAEPQSVKIIQSPNPGFDQSARDYMLRALFRPARVHGRAVRVLVNIPIDYSIRAKR